ncbi:MAG TPA: hypothetical protein VLD62_02965 [Acidimicrobiia bacterium]|nr:hypothetical protein [Acidimicrobiia bacterium]
MRYTVLCPLGATTGGPEALHQLASELRSVGRDAGVLYMQEGPLSVPIRALRRVEQRVLKRHGAEVPPLGRFHASGLLEMAMRRLASVTLHSVPLDAGRTPPPYLGYEARVVGTLPPDTPAETIVVPEVWWPFALRWKRATVALWWLSIDNASRVIPGAVRALRRPNVVNLVQSRYAEVVVRGSGGRRVLPVSDYISTGARTHPEAPREDIVAYNPKKGSQTTAALMNLLPDTRFVPIEGLDPSGVAGLLRRAKLYIDFGPFPGRDRLPREALLAGCVVISGRAGASLLLEDLPIPEAYKVDSGDLGRISELIGEVLADHPNHEGLFDEARRKVAADRDRFRNEVAMAADAIEAGACS